MIQPNLEWILKEGTRTKFIVRQFSITILVYSIKPTKGPRGKYKLRGESVGCSGNRNILVSVSVRTSRRILRCTGDTVCASYGLIVSTRRIEALWPEAACPTVVVAARMGVSRSRVALGLCWA